LAFAHGLGLQRLLISCAETNLASRRVIESNGGTPAEQTPQRSEVPKGKRLYWVKTQR
jgi:predicted acetyltransferase